MIPIQVIMLCGKSAAVIAAPSPAVPDCRPIICMAIPATSEPNPAAALLAKAQPAEYRPSRRAPRAEQMLMLVGGIGHYRSEGDGGHSHHRAAEKSCGR